MSSRPVWRDTAAARRAGRRSALAPRRRCAQRVPGGRSSPGRPHGRVQRQQASERVPARRAPGLDAALPFCHCAAGAHRCHGDRRTIQPRTRGGDAAGQFNHHEIPTLSTVPTRNNSADVRRRESTPIASVRPAGAPGLAAPAPPPSSARRRIRAGPSPRVRSRHLHFDSVKRPVGLRVRVVAENVVRRHVLGDARQVARMSFETGANPSVSCASERNTRPRPVSLGFTG